ncbi:hypothetical protein LZ554_004219 [Drepanopeziza brunnea f. sp. 'monogermtubi']|nr:hypothetical protein LZ554_004219 [Drepanopeziza brunnea f. sp. 'monogermtubi']
MIGFTAAFGREGVSIVKKSGSEVAILKEPVEDLLKSRSLLIRHQRPKIYCYRKYIFSETNSNLGTFSGYCIGSTVYNAIVSSAKCSERAVILGIGGLACFVIQFSSRLEDETIVSLPQTGARVLSGC